MKRYLITLALFASLASLSIAHAGKPGNNGGGKGGCGVGQTTNGCGGTTATGTTNNGGAGGSVVGSGNSANVNTAIGGAGGAGGKATIEKGAVDNRNMNVNTNTAAQQQTAISGGNTVTSTVTVQGDQNPVSSAIASGLTAANGTCMGSTSAGAQGVTIGLSVGTTWKSDECNRRYNSIRMQELGQTKAAVALMCQDASVAEAMKQAGTPCPSATSTPASTKTADAYSGTDPIVKARLGIAE